MMIMRRVLSQQSRTVARIHKAYCDPSQKRAFLKLGYSSSRQRQEERGPGLLDPDPLRLGAATC
jgi:hypothetical protein